MLSENVAGWPDEAVLMVDDYHLVMESTAAERFVELRPYAEARLCGCSLQPAGRPTWASTRRLLAGEVYELLADVLAMNDEGDQRCVGGAIRLSCFGAR